VPEARDQRCGLLQRTPEVLRGYPCIVAPENGTELTLNAIRTWQQDQNVERHRIAPGKLMPNGFVEGFNGRLPDECLAKRLFFSRRLAAT
jgi:putative transposase